ncbi:MAG: hypothetical protein AAFO94_22530, partial [Bacteroidota bacterium]
LPLNDYLEIGVFGVDDQEIYKRKHLVKQIDNTLTLVVNEVPKAVAIDPYYLMIDRELEDNWLRKY